MSTVISQELYFNELSKYLDLYDLTRILLADPDFGVYDTKSNWLICYILSILNITVN